MKKILNYLYEQKTLSNEQAKDILHNIGAGQYNDAQIASFLTVFIMRGITVEELQGFRDAMLELCVHIDLSEFDPMDLCGTGGDGKNTFNISTLASFVAAGAGVKVAKHGNYGVSSVSGSSNMIQHFGYEFTNDADKLKRSIDKSNICFLHAPLFHPAMKHVAPVRRAMKVKTFFNMLGPMVNPAFVKKQLVGVFSLEVARLYGYLLQQSESKRYAIVHAIDGYDEISLTCPVKVITSETEQLLNPEDFNLPKLQQSDIYGGETVAEAAQIFETILKGEGTAAQNSVVLVNAATAIQVATDLTFENAFELAKDTLMGGRALKTFKTFLEI